MRPAPPTRALALLALLLTLAVRPASAHQSVAFPIPISKDLACRISRTENCPGPCPRRRLRRDQTPNNPSVTVRRGQTLVVRTLRNNHDGGFSRWSLVNVRDMYNKWRHTQNAFLFTCSDLNVAKCRARNRRRDCHFDRDNEFFTHFVKIPTNAVDGVYVLGWVWFGGGKRWGEFGDYYDCVYIEVRGGPFTRTFRPQFRPGNSRTGSGGKCRATVNKVGVCWSEPCPGGGRYTQLMKPWPFANGRRPAPIPASRLRAPYRPPRKKHNSPRVRSMTIRSADVPSKVYTSSLWTHSPHIFLTRAMRVTLTCETSGKVRGVAFYVDGRAGRIDYKAPYSAAGDWVHWKTKKVQYAPWAFNINRKAVTLSCRAFGWDGTEDFKTIHLSTDF